MSFWEDIKEYFAYKSKLNKAYRQEKIKNAETEAKLNYQISLEKKKKQLENQKKPFLEREF